MKEEKISLEQSLVIGSKDKLTTSVNSSAKPLVVRGIIKKDRMNVCKQQGRDFYYIDTGYFGNFPNESNPSGKKIYHRIVSTKSKSKFQRLEKLRQKNIISYAKS